MLLRDTSTYIHTNEKVGAPCVSHVNKTRYNESHDPKRTGGAESKKTNKQSEYEPFQSNEASSSLLTSERV